MAHIQVCGYTYTVLYDMVWYMAQDGIHGEVVRLVQERLLWYLSEVVGNYIFSVSVVIEGSRLVVECS